MTSVIFLFDVLVPFHYSSPSTNKILPLTNAAERKKSIISVASKKELVE